MRQILLNIGAAGTTSTESTTSIDNSRQANHISKGTEERLSSCLTLFGSGQIGVSPLSPACRLARLEKAKASALPTTSRVLKLRNGNVRLAQQTALRKLTNDRMQRDHCGLSMLEPRISCWNTPSMHYR